MHTWRELHYVRLHTMCAQESCAMLGRGIAFKFAFYQATWLFIKPKTSKFVSQKESKQYFQKSRTILAGLTLGIGCDNVFEFRGFAVKQMSNVLRNSVLFVILSSSCRVFQELWTILLLCAKKRVCRKGLLAGLASAWGTLTKWPKNNGTYWVFQTLPSPLKIKTGRANFSPGSSSIRTYENFCKLLTP